MLSTGRFGVFLAFGALALVPALFTGCSCDKPSVEAPTLYSEPGPMAADGEESAIQESEVSSKSIELLWLVPGVAVDSYELRYGLSSDALEHSLSLSSASLETLDHPDHGPVYRYLLNADNWTGPICYTIRAQSTYGKSETSAATCVD